LLYGRKKERGRQVKKEKRSLFNDYVIFLAVKVSARAQSILLSGAEEPRLRNSS
jgi:hypothetical protein